ncbi:hypothetical protein LTR66_011656, partial [Elasticomyces elasticus]
ETGEAEALAGLRPWNFIVNMRAGTADLPCDGGAAVTFTEMRDVAAFVLAAVDLPTWPEELGMQGDVRSFSQVVDIVERVQKRTFLRRENAIDEMREMARMPQASFYNQVRIAIANGWGFVEPVLNRECPHVKPVTVEEFVERWWSGVELGEPSWDGDQYFM